MLLLLYYSSAWHIATNRQTRKKKAHQGLIGVTAAVSPSSSSPSPSFLSPLLLLRLRLLLVIMIIIIISVTSTRRLTAIVCSNLFVVVVDREKSNWSACASSGEVSSIRARGAEHVSKSNNDAPRRQERSIDRKTGYWTDDQSRKGEEKGTSNEIMYPNEDICHSIFCQCWQTTQRSTSTSTEAVEKERDVRRRRCQSDWPHCRFVIWIEILVFALNPSEKKKRIFPNVDHRSFENKRNNRIERRNAFVRLANKEMFIDNESMMMMMKNKASTYLE